jgi:salicylate hydroxylase
MAQGAAQAIEDGACLAACLAAEDAPAALRRYEELRLPRTARIQALSSANKARYHLPDGPEQEARDEEMATGKTDWSTDAVAWIWGHDASAIG